MKQSFQVDPLNTCNLLVDVLYIIAPAITPTKLPLCVEETLGGIINLLVASGPAFLKSAAPTITVDPTPIPSTTILDELALIVTFSNSVEVLIPILPEPVTNNCHQHHY